VRALGVNVAIDDFGTGYSSLGYLAKLPVRSLKIDRSFINAMHKDLNAMTLVSTIISLAHSLQLKVIADRCRNGRASEIPPPVEARRHAGLSFQQAPIARRAGLAAAGDFPELDGIIAKRHEFLLELTRAVVLISD
jgi:hypothetical protein